MGTTAVVGIVILAWISLSIVLALMVAGTIRLRNQQLPRRSTPKPPTECDLRHAANPPQRTRRWRKRSKT